MKTFSALSLAAFLLCSQINAEEDDVAFRTVADSIGTFGHSFLKAVTAENSGNLITSSLSAQIVLAMAAYGAGGSTATQLRQGLSIPENNELGQSGFEAVLRKLNATTGVTLNLANSLFVGSDLELKSEYKQMTRDKFSSEIQSVDFRNSQAAADTINSWCEEKTNNRIQNVIDPKGLDPLTKLILVNALYFKGEWKKKFPIWGTRDKTFHVDEQTSIEVPTMFVNSYFQIGQIPELNAKFILLPYKNSPVSLCIVVPNEVSGFKTLKDNLDRLNLRQITDEAESKDVNLYVPKFKISTTLDLRGPLTKLGLAEMFGDTANFTGITDVPLHVGKVVQKAFIEVDEDGTEAAAVTVLEAVATSLFIPIRPPTIFEVDKSFYYAIYHHEAKTTLFNGFVSRPELA